jgi:high-affinity Fe2+/Pb2+ permease
MASWSESTHSGRGHHTFISGPLLAAMAVAIGLAAAGLSFGRLLPTGQFLPAMGTVLLFAAAGVALIAWMHPAKRSASGPTYWDVCGLLVFLSICAGVGSEAEQVIALVGLDAPPN